MDGCTQEGLGHLIFVRLLGTAWLCGTKSLMEMGCVAERVNDYLLLLNHLLHFAQFSAVFFLESFDLAVLDLFKAFNLLPGLTE